MKSIAGFLLAALVLSAVAFMLGSYQTDVYRKLLLWITLALGYNFLFGIAGQVAFSHFTFYGIGAYAMVILLFQVGLPLPLAIVAGIVVCVVLALVVAIPATRLEGFYLALATLAFAQLFIVVLNEGGSVTGGPGGLANYRLPDIAGVRVTGPWYTVVIVFLLLGTLATLWRLDRSWFGRACRAVRDDPQAAQAMGINVTTTRIVAYAVTSALAGVAACLYGISAGRHPRGMPHPGTTSTRRTAADEHSHANAHHGPGGGPFRRRSVGGGGLRQRSLRADRRGLDIDHGLGLCQV